MAGPEIFPLVRCPGVSLRSVHTHHTHTHITHMRPYIHTYMHGTRSCVHNQRISHENPSHSDFFPLGAQHRKEEKKTSLVSETYHFSRHHNFPPSGAAPKRLVSWGFWTRIFGHCQYGL